MERENFYILLELSYDPPVTDPAQIKTALQNKRQEWTRWQDNPSKRNIALTNLGLIGEIESVMLNPAQRQKEAEAAIGVRGEMRRQFEAELRILEGKGYLTPKEAAAIAVKYKNYGVDRARVADTARVPISETPPAARDEADTGEILDRITAKTIHRDLGLLGYADLYAFLEEPQNSSIKKLCDAAESKRRAAAGAGTKSSAATITQELSGICLRMFTDFDSKQKYDRYLKVGRYPELCDLIDQENNRVKFLSPDILLRLCNFAVEKYHISVLDAEDTIRRYCAAYDIPIDSQSRQMNCPACGNKTDRDGAVCTVCAQPLRGECPGCGSHFEEGPSVCPECGFALADMVKALRYIGDGENALIENNWSTAQRSLQYARKYWPGHPRLAPLEKRAVLLEERYAHYVDTIADCVKHNQYYAALDMVNEAAARRIQLPLATVAHVEKVVAELERSIGELHEHPENQSFEAIMQLAETVSDSIELSHLMRRHPPEAPEKLLATPHERHVRLTWSVSTATGLKDYVVVRKQSESPLTAYDGDILYEGKANSFLDKTCTPLVDYYYSIYTRRGGAYSATAAMAGPVLIVPEIEELRILPTDQGAQLSWAYNPDIKEVTIWRKLGGERPTAQGDGIRLENTRLDGYTDSRIKNGVEYWYFLVATFLVGGRPVMSRGVCDSVIPHKLLAPIENLHVVRTDNEDEYVVSWQGSQYSDVLLFASHRKPAVKTGEMTPLRELIEQYRKLDIDVKQRESARFRYSWNGGVYIFPVVITGNFATVGEIKYLANVQDVQSATYDIVEGDLFLNMKWPPGLTEVLVSYRFDRFPKVPGENGATMIRYSREQYDYDAGVLIKDPEPAVYYVTIFSAFVTPEAERVYSTGVNLTVNNMAQQEIMFRFSRTKKLFSQVSVITATISSDEAFTMPRAVIIGKVGRLPLNKSDGIPLFEIDRETKVKGSVVYEYRASSLPDNLYIRLFLQDENLYENFRLLPLGGLKITN